MIVFGSHSNKGNKLDADGLVADKCNQNLWVYTADCLPIFFADKRTRNIAVLHCGRKGLEKRIIKNLVKILVNLGTSREDLLAAIGPAISIMMEGYVEGKKLVSLRGTLVPATTINRTISSIPLLGDLLVGKKVGEGVFGVSFKIKGPPKDLKTRVNPIKTLTPRFITRTLEKIKKN